MATYMVKLFQLWGVLVPTIQDVADLAGVSIATVSRVMNNSAHRVSRDTRARVLRAIRELDYRPNALAKGLLIKKTMTIGIVIPDISNPYYAEIVRGIQDTADNAGYAVILQNTDRKKDRILRYVYLLREKLADGVIFSGGAIHFPELLAALGELRERVVVIGRYDTDLPAVRVDNEGGALQATEHLAALGHRRIAFIGGPSVSTTIQDRLKGYRRALLQNGIEADRGLIKQSTLTLEGGYRAAGELLAQPGAPTAILAASDQMSFGAVRAVREAGLRVPEDVSVIGFDNLPLSACFTPPLTTVSIPRHDLGVAAVEMLLNLIAGGSLETVRWFRTALVVRDSTCSAGSRAAGSGGA